jgi:hypothetical protein
MDDTITGQLNMDDLNALAAQALVSAASDYCRGRTQVRRCPAGPRWDGSIVRFPVALCLTFQSSFKPLFCFPTAIRVLQQRSPVWH